jgi:type IV secretion system protein VirB9
VIRNRTIAYSSFASGLLAIMAMWLPASVARAEVLAPKGLLDSRIRVVFYDGDQVYRLRGYLGYQIDLEFETGETFLGLGAGDLEGLAYFGQDNHLFLKPKAAQVATNLTVLTTRHHYQFEYTSVARRPVESDPDAIFVLRFTYPEDASKAKAAQTRDIDAALARAGAQHKNSDYWYCGGTSLRPVSASDDGVRTRLRFSAHGDLPAIFVKNEDGSEALINYNVDEGDVVIHRIAHQFILRRGNLAGCVTNKGFVGGGVRLDSGTVTPDVERTVQGVAP